MCYTGWCPYEETKGYDTICYKPPYEECPLDKWDDEEENDDELFEKCRTNWNED